MNRGALIPLIAGGFFWLLVAAIAVGAVYVVVHVLP
jgi:hypothetical protein